MTSLTSLRYLFCLLLILFNTEIINAQSAKPVLERLITIKSVNENADAVLSKLAVQGGVEFSYNPSVIDVSKPVTLNLTNRPLREALNTIFEGKVEYREKGKYLILQKKKERIPQPKKPEKELFTFSGYVRNDSGVPLSWTSIYDKVSLESTVSNDYGYYRIRFYRHQLPVSLYFSKQGYRDTLLTLDQLSPEFTDLVLVKRELSVPPVADTLSVQQQSSLFTSLEQPVSVQNISDTIYRKWQVSFVPFAGTNGKLSGNVINDYSFNIFGGYSLGNRKMELAGFFNLNRGDVSFVQMAGFANVSGGQIRGAQLAGFVNVVKEDVKAWQLAGFTNLNASDFSGAQFAGFSNSVNGKASGFQAAGFTNVTRRSMVGTQVSGFANVVLDSIRGTQIGFINYARHVTGSQIGFLNITKSTTGVPVGFLSFVLDGYHKVEVAADEVFYLNLSLRTGVKSFHNILTSGINPGKDSLNLWHFGYGVGSTVDLSKNTALDFDVTASQIVQGNNFDKINLLAKGYLGADIKLKKQLSMIVGVTVNAHIYKTDYTSYPELFSWYKPNIFYDHTWELDKTRMQMWLGAKVGLRFF